MDALRPCPLGQIHTPTVLDRTYVRQLKHAQCCKRAAVVHGLAPGGVPGLQPCGELGGHLRQAADGRGQIPGDRAAAGLAIRAASTAALASTYVR